MGDWLARLSIRCQEILIARRLGIFLAFQSFTPSTSPFRFTESDIPGFRAHLPDSASRAHACDESPSQRSWATIVLAAYDNAHNLSETSVPLRFAGSS